MSDTRKKRAVDVSCFKTYYSFPGVVGGGEEDRIRLLYKLILINKYDISTLFSSWRYNTSNQVCTSQAGLHIQGRLQD